VTWDGRTDAGAIVPDGEYVLVVTARDGCGRTADAHARLEVDTVAPAAEIVRPRGGDSVSATTDVRGFVTDPHLDGYELQVGVGETPTDWITIRANPYAVPGSASAFGLLGRWETPTEVGPYVLPRPRCRWNEAPESPRPGCPSGWARGRTWPASPRIQASRRRARLRPTR
jgi:hypothetical protein